MNFDELVKNIEQVSTVLKQSVNVSINTHTTARNWLVGFYIVEFEQNGENRAEYGSKLLEKLSNKLNIKGLSKTNLKLFRQFYLTYPQIATIFSSKLLPGISQTVSDQLGLPITEKLPEQISQTVSDQFVIGVPADKLIQKLSFSHFVELLPIDDFVKRTFYEVECIKGTWDVRELRRQINSLYYERSGLSRKPELLSSIVQQNTIKKPDALDTIKSPYTFEFLGLKSQDVVYESDLEQALIDHLEAFMLELGHGFCFEAKQKRIIIGEKCYFCDLVFYNRVLKCHVLVELKVDEFTYEHIGQLKTYVNYYRKEVMLPDDNPPIGILLVTNKDNALVEYAMADNDKDIFVSKYLLELPTKEQLIKFINQETNKFD
ncbi:MAG: PDDEXK nuclease domain-containing protein [Prevotellaceae bacterium]|jgi:predicted nuclease of restriction endonuclease-like (RecB) superfamily|nr:PDDEXK nuclease domain-containing protein [Prevotellaceae bacterium]